MEQLYYVITYNMCMYLIIHLFIIHVILCIRVHVHVVVEVSVYFGNCHLNTIN